MQLNEQLDYNIEDDELIRLVSTSSDSSNQFVIFKNGQGRLYAINVAKVEELIVYKEIDVVKNSDPTALIHGVAKIRNYMTSLVVFDRWLNTTVLDDREYELLILCHYGYKRLAIVIHSVVGIHSIESNQLVDNSERDSKTSYVTEVVINNKKELCLVFDSERLLADMFPELQQQHEEDLKRISTEIVQTDKWILVAEDSRIIQTKMMQLLEKMQLKVHMFPDGKKLWEWLERNGKKDVNMVISDVEMPVMDGISLLKHCKEHSDFKALPFLMHTNMANPAIIKSAMQYGAQEVVKKIDFETLQSTILKYL